ncbi:MAG: hypothetical protein ABW252_06075 [Polyangiales bacterium]
MRAAFRFALASLLLTMLATGLDGPAVRAAPGKPVPIAVVVSARSTWSEISLALLRRAFLGELAEYAGVRLVPFNHDAADPVRVAFDAQVLDMTAAMSGRYWVDRRIRGQGLPPRTIATVALLRAVIARLPGGIGYLPADQLDASVKALQIDGLAPGHPAYPLRVERGP